MPAALLSHIRGWREKIPFLEPLVLTGIAILWFLLWGFLEIAEEVGEGDTHALDTKILLLMRDAGDPADPWGPLWFEEMVRDISGLGGIAVLALVTLGAAFYLVMLGKKGQGAYLLATIAAGTFLSNLLKYGYARPRPDLVPHGSHVFTGSFPSGHSMMSALVYLTVGMLLARAHQGRSLKIYFIAMSVVLTVAIGVSRVYLGVHWPTDILAGWMIGALCAIVFWLIEYMWQERVSRTRP